MCDPLKNLSRLGWNQHLIVREMPPGQRKKLPARIAAGDAAGVAPSLNAAARED